MRLLADDAIQIVIVMHRSRPFATLLCLFALWLQMLAPAWAMRHQQNAVPGAIICHGGDTSDGHRAPFHHAPSCEHCLLCHAVAGGLPADGRPAFTLFDYPASSILRWTVADYRRPIPRVPRDAQPRGPPHLV